MRGGSCQVYFVAIFTSLTTELGATGWFDSDICVTELTAIFGLADASPLNGRRQQAVSACFAEVHAAGVSARGPPGDSSMNCCCRAKGDRTPGATIRRGSKVPKDSRGLPMIPSIGNKPESPDKERRVPSKPMFSPFARKPFYQSRTSLISSNGHHLARLAPCVCRWSELSIVYR
jgi:hypothetical protein